MRNVKSLDLNLLVAFDAMMSERNVTRAGQRIGLAQPSMSNALARLRALFDDELFVRTPAGMVPTALAVEAAHHVTAAIAAAESAINVGADFNPETADADIRLLTNDLIELTALPQVMRALHEQAPGIRLFTRAAVRDEFAPVLDSGEADIAICAAGQIAKRFHHIPLFREPFVCIARKGHPEVKTDLTLEAFLACRHALISHRQDGVGIVDAALGAMDLSRKVVASVSGFAALPNMIAETDLIAALPRRLALKAQETLPLNIYELPIHVPSVDAQMIWGRGVDRSPMFSWFRDLVVRSVARRD